MYPDLPAFMAEMQATVRAHSRGRRRSFASLQRRALDRDPRSPFRGLDLHTGVHGKPLNLCAWACLFEHGCKDRYLWRTKVGATEVSTVWMGTWPCLFESAVFDDDHFDTRARYPTQRAARRGHARLVAEERAKVQ